MADSIRERAQAAVNLVSASNEFREVYNKDPFYNNAWRHFVFQDSLRDQFSDVDSIVLDPEGNTGPDFTWKSHDIHAGEMKAQWFNAKTLTRSSLGVMAFDKQNDPYRRKKLFRYDAFVYGLFRRDGNLIFRLSILGKDNAEKVYPLIATHQREKIKQIEECARLDKGLPRDDIRIPVYDVIEALDDQNMVINLVGKQYTRDEFLAGVPYAS